MIERSDLVAAIERIGTQEFSRSGGPGGQNVNKVNTQVTLRVPLSGLGLTPAEVHRVTARLAGRCNAEGELVIQVSDTRSQQQNRELAVQRAADLIAGAVKQPRRRRATRPTAASRERRLTEKKRRSRVKGDRRTPEA